MASNPSNLNEFHADWPDGDKGLPVGLLMIPAFFGLLFIIVRHGIDGIVDFILCSFFLAIPGMMAINSIYRLLDHSPFLKISRSELRFHPSCFTRRIKRDFLEQVDVNIYRFVDQPSRFELSVPMTKSGVAIDNIIIFYRLGERKKLKKFEWITGLETEKYSEILREFGWL